VGNEFSIFPCSQRPLLIVARTSCVDLLHWIGRIRANGVRQQREAATVDGLTRKRVGAKLRSSWQQQAESRLSGDDCYKRELTHRYRREEESRQ